MAANLFQPSLTRSLDANGNPIGGAKMYFYVTGTYTPATWFTDQAAESPGTNPLVADSSGIFPPAYLDPDTTYRIILRADDESVTIWDVDPIRGFDETQLREDVEAAIASSISAQQAKTAAETARTQAQTAQGIAELARDDAQAAALASTGYYPGARSHPPRGLTAVTITAPGSGGTDGTYTCPLTGDNLTADAFATVVVTGGVVVSVGVSAPGLYIGASPTPGLVDTSAITGLTGATLTPTISFLRESGEYYLTDHASDPERIALFQNQAGAAAEIIASVDWLNIAQARAYSEAAAEALADAEALTASMFRSGTLDDRGPTPFQDYPHGFHYFVNDINPPRLFMWCKAGQRNPSGAVVGSDSWFSYYTPTEIKNLGIDFTGALPSVNVADLPEAFAAIDGIANIEIADFRAEALSNATNPAVALSWSIKGIQPTSQQIAWGGHRVTVDGKARSFSPPDYSTVTGIGTVGNSLSDSTDVTTRYSQLLATEYGVDLVSVARYSSDWRQVYRLGAAPITLTVSGDTLPAGGTSTTITHINGVAPTNDPSVNPASFLNVGDPGVVTGLSMGGWIGDRHVTVSIPNGASTTYSIVQDAGAASLALDGPVLFVPDVSLQFSGRTCVVWLGNNYFFSGVPNVYGDHTNPQMWVDMAAIIQFLQARGCRVLLLPVIPSADWTTSGLGTARDAYQAANARTEALYPDLFARNGAGLDLIEYLQTQGNGSTNDNADIAAGFIPRSLRVSGDSLHLNATGDARVATFVQAALAAQAEPPAITQSTIFSLTAEGVNPRTGDAMTDSAVAAVQGAVPTVWAEGYVQASTPTTSAPALWFDISNPDFVTLKIQRGA